MRSPLSARAIFAARHRKYRESCRKDNKESAKTRSVPRPLSRGRCAYPPVAYPVSFLRSWDDRRWWGRLSCEQAPGALTGRELLPPTRRQILLRWPRRRDIHAPALKLKVAL